MESATVSLIRQILLLTLDVQKPKSFQLKLSASGGLRPPDQGSAPGPRWGLRPQTPIIGSRYRARHNHAPRLFQIPPRSWGARIVPVSRAVLWIGWRSNYAGICLISQSMSLRMLLRFHHGPLIMCITEANVLTMAAGRQKGHSVSQKTSS